MGHTDGEYVDAIPTQPGSAANLTRSSHISKSWTAVIYLSPRSAPEPQMSDLPLKVPVFVPFGLEGLCEDVPANAPTCWEELTAVLWTRRSFHLTHKEEQRRKLWKNILQRAHAVLQASQGAWDSHFTWLIELLVVYQPPHMLENFLEVFPYTSWPPEECALAQQELQHLNDLDDDKYPNDLEVKTALLSE